MAVKTLKTQWRDVVLVCRKCSRKLDGGFGPRGDQGLHKALRRELKSGKGPKATITIKQVDCFDVCPKNAVAAVNAARPRVLLVIPRGTPAVRAAAALGLLSGVDDGVVDDGVTEAGDGSRPTG